NLLWGTFFGAGAGAPGFTTSCRDIAIDNNTGKIYITGQGDLPVLMNAGGFYQAAVGGLTDTYIAAFNNNHSLAWSTYMGGAATDYPCAIHCDDLGNIVLTGITNSANFPTKNPGAGAYYQAANAGGYDIYIAKFNPSTNLFWSTYYGGSADDESMSNGDPYKPEIVTDKKNNIYVTGMTKSLNFPTYNSGCGSFLYNTGCNVIMQFCPSGVRLWATKFGEEGGYNGTNLGSANRFTSACAFDDATNSVYAGGEVYGPTMVNPLVNPGGGALFNSPFTAGDCSFIIKFKILPVTLNMSSINATACSGCNGNSTVTATCGVAPYTYNWSNGQSTQTATGLCAGTYSVIVKDAGCEQDTAYITINSGSGSMTLAVSKTDAGCGINNGTATAAPGSGTSPYTYNWSNGQTGQTATGLCPGSYTVSVIDAGGCFSTRSVTVSQPSAIVVNVNSSTQIICNNNSINVTVSGSGGSIPYVYNWNNGQAGATATGLVAGTYTVTTTDASGCSAIKSVVVTKIPPAFFSIYTTNGTCGNGGSATLFVYGGTQPYTYSWSGLSQTIPNITAIPAGTYTTTVSDANGCTTTKSFTITDTPALASATFTQSPGTTVCVGTLVNFTNTGNPPGTGVTYNWVISPTTPTISGTTTDFSYTFLTAGSYTVTHTVSAGGCSKTVTSTVNVITCTGGPNATALGSSVCPGSCATATSSAAGGSAPYTYLWSNGATTQNISPCPASTTTYTVTIKDSGGNTSTSTAVVTINPA
ncbi:MAG: PKD domain-containing protein, partial [Bacteroidia bacterium]|nr:PKD domain-containing protein [Bacteroidia bacterium]